MCQQRVVKSTRASADECPVRVIGFVALLWGCAAVGFGLTRGLDSYTGSYAADVALGAALSVAGGLILVRRARSSG